MKDLAFALEAAEITSVYRWPLWRALLEVLPWLEAASEAGAGVHALKLVHTGDGQGHKVQRQAWLTRRARLVLRVPDDRAEATAAALCGQELTVEEAAGGDDALRRYTLRLRQCMERPLHVSSTLYSDCVTTGSADELDFCRDLDAELDALGVRCHYICGGSRELATGQAGAPGRLSGYALALHDLSPEHSLLLQERGLGRERRFGCGIFIPHKAISGL